MVSNTPQPEAAPAAGTPESGELVSVRHEGAVRRMDLITFVALIQQGTFGPATEVSSKQLTGDVWQPLSELECYRVLQGKDRVEAKSSASATEADGPDRNLDRLFESHAVSRLQVDGVVAGLAVVLVAVLSAFAHRFWLFPLLAAAAAFAGYMLTNQWLFRRWLLKVKTRGFQRMPWKSRFLVLVSVVVIGYFLVSLFIPMLPSENLLRLIDGVVVMLFAGVAAVVVTFRIDLLRARRVYEISK